MNFLKWFYQSAVLGVLTYGLVSCGTLNPSMKTSSQEKNQIESILVQDFPDKTEIIIEGKKPLSYTSYSLGDPLRYVIDLTDTSRGKYKEKIEINSGEISSIVPIENAQPAIVTRLEVGLLKQVEPSVRKEGVKLFVDVPKGEAGRAGASEASPADTNKGEESLTTSFSTTSASSATSESTTSQAEAPAETPPAASPSTSAVAEQTPKTPNQVESIQVDQSEQIVDVKISGDLASPKIFKLKGNRLVVDFPGATHQVRPLIQNINIPPLMKIRIAQHPKPKKVRIVLDLTQNGSFTTSQEAGHFIIHLNREMTSEPLSPKGEKENEKTAQNEPPADMNLENPAPEPTPPPSPLSLSRPKSGNVLFVEKTQKNRKKYTGEKIFLNFQDTDITNVLRIISEVSGFNFVIGDDVKGKVNLKLKSVPWDQALDLILKMNNLGQIREGNIIRIATLGNITKLQDDELKAKDSMDKTEDLVTQVLHINYAKVSEIIEPLKKIMSVRGEINSDIRTNSLIVKDIERNANQIADLVKTLDSPTPQVLIEARIVQVNPTFVRSLGVQWGANSTSANTDFRLGVTTGTTGGAFAQTNDFAVNLPAAPNFGAVGFSLGRLTGDPLNLDLRISAGESRGLTKIISTPKITVLDNLEAKIEQGESIPYATTSLQGTQTTFVDANLTLLVTPHVTNDGSVIMKIKTTKNAPGTTLTGAAGPSIIKKEATTSVLIKDGDTAVIGGIYETSKTNSINGVPLLSNIPVLGWLFKTKTVNDTTTELLVFLTPKILK